MKVIFLFLLSSSIFACGVNESIDCPKLYSRADSLVNNFHLKHDTLDLWLAMDTFNIIHNRCPEFRRKISDQKIRLFFLLEEYQWGASFVDSMKEEAFSIPYEKRLLYYNFRALEFEQQGDLLKRDDAFDKAVAVVREHTINNPSDTGGIIVLVSTMARYRKKEDVFEEIEAQRKNAAIKDDNFFDVLHSTIDDYYYIIRYYSTDECEVPNCNQARAAGVTW